MIDTRQKQHILIVDDDKETVRLVWQYLEQAGYAVLVAYDAETAVHILRREELDLLILDLGLSDKDGWDITRFIRADDQLSALPIIMLTARIDDREKIIGLELGADDYIPKPFNVREVVARVWALLRRVQMASPPRSKILRVHELALDVGKRELLVSGNPVELAPIEYELIHIFISCPNTTFDREELLERAVGYAYEGMSRTLDPHIKNLRHKIEAAPKQPLYMQTVHRVGYRLVEGRT
ncbi:MAG: DNA-binding response regulator, OmpR family, contains REC and winged-helix (wHTH) domain [Chloroflexi bacterium AL-W]|nr:DNA-binding response regulator, OmpR family, contains REC and winged-helix (wHTH) domain [Chloroflexi bacterium AL-N1]NOK66488.1 DNA-binding response regulator, OmpR family, contains REC and winged-helix (wHTH) domain [Chloroflexi bacterium AL-N10]NOK71876.1 DNA-binding response regulator, OmpR family, contains REC and winged-helix (wHTH) domain [Chloroflexi bacterium AL-N5]NOK81133.1 DNA-binding response regulator, OmpR family, contains REC and winged-helix (wHTH) domain [Chloroflexi bacteri